MAAAHSLRIMLVVLIVPLLLNAFEVHGRDPYVPSAREFSWGGFALLAAVTGGAALVMGRLGFAEQLDDRAVAGGGGRDRARRHLVVAAAGSTAGSCSIGIGPEQSLHAEVLEVALRFPGGGRDHAGVPRHRRCLRLAAVARLRPALGRRPSSPPRRAASVKWRSTAQALRLGVPIVTAFHAIRMAVVVHDRWSDLPRVDAVEKGSEPMPLELLPLTHEAAPAVEDFHAAVDESRASLTRWMPWRHAQLRHRRTSSAGSREADRMWRERYGAFHMWLRDDSRVLGVIGIHDIQRYGKSEGELATPGAPVRARPRRGEHRDPLNGGVRVQRTAPGARLAAHPAGQRV